MNGDDELEGSDEQDFREHFAPVARSIRRTVTSRTIQVYAVSFVGIVILSASIGPAVVGAYATVQEDYGLCSDPDLEVSSADDTAELTAGNDVPEFVRLDYDELSTAEQRAFRAALASANGVKPIEGDVEHRSAFRDGALVTYQGENHYAVIGSRNDCVTDSFNLPLSIAGLVVGSGLVIAPGVWRLRGNGAEEAVDE
ncbi:MULTISPECIES: FecR/PupR family sigma factor regulator [Halococcus]|uniref:DUF7979 domain-containing protein n=1 Tax=Halococcus salifodinae DSM 8989 TaxID=1227456 RepID=M0N6A7_9EURY|nr:MULTISPECIES: FecR/PupR family sigma factor regulator [Halococcus]EMA52654.1 hypothetical protein C450_11163 [Halococcus salifodinae DSM 8989]